MAMARNCYPALSRAGLAWQAYHVPVEAGNVREVARITASAPREKDPEGLSLAVVGPSNAPGQKERNITTSDIAS